MNTFVHFFGPKNTALYVQIAASELEIKFVDVVNAVAPIIKKDLDPQFDIAQYSLFTVDSSVCIETPNPKEIEDITQQMIPNSPPTFDIILARKDRFRANHLSPSHQPYSSSATADSEAYLEQYQSGIRCAAVKAYKDACIWFQKCRNMKDSDPRPCQAIVKVLIKTHRYQTALTNAAALNQKFPSDFLLRFLFAKAHQKLQLHKEAIELFRSSLLLIPQQSSAKVQYEISKSLLCLGQAQEALQLLSSLCPTETPSVKILKAKILISLGRFIEAITIVLSIFWDCPDYTKVQKFIAENISSQTQLEVLNSELGDSLKNAKVNFFLAQTFFNCGSLELSAPYFSAAFQLSPKDPSIALGCLKSLIFSTNDVVRVADFSKKVLSSNKTVFDPSSSHFDSVFDFTAKSDYEENCHSAQFSPIIFEQSIKPPFSVAQLDIFAFLIHLQQFLFCNGYITKAEQITTQIAPFLVPFSFSESVISYEILLFSAIASLAPSVPRPLPHLKPIYVVGGIHCLALSWRTIDIRGEKFLSQPIYIHNASITKLAKGTPQKAQFWRFIEGADNDSTIIICLGEADCVKGSVRKIDRIEFDSFEAAFEKSVSDYVSILQQILKMKMVKIFIHPVPPTFLNTRQTVPIFNKMLKEKIASNAFSLPGVEFLDFTGDMLSEDKESLKSAYTYSDVLMNFSYIPLMEKWIADHPPVPPTQLAVGTEVPPPSEPAID